MTVQVVLRARAEGDLRAAHRWYERIREGLGEQFLAAVQERLGELSQYPDACPILYRQVRRAVVSRFPYLVFYVARPSRVDVLAVLHHARNPARWPVG